MMRFHMIWMLLICVLPLLLIFFAPAFLPGDSWSLFFFLMICFAAHFFLMSGMHGGDGHEGHSHRGGSHDSHKRT